MLLFYREKHIENTNNENDNTSNALELYKKRQDKKYSNLKTTKNREINDLKETIGTIREQKDKYKDSTITLNHNVTHYKSLYDDLNKKHQKISVLTKEIEKLISNKKQKDFTKIKNKLNTINKLVK